MAIFAAHCAPEFPRSSEALQQARVYRVGFVWPALLFAPLWLIARRLWRPLALWIVVAALVAAAIGESADARQHDVLGARDVVRVARHFDDAVESGFARGAFKGFVGGVKVARTVVDDCDVHFSRPPRGTDR